MKNAKNKILNFMGSKMKAVMTHGDNRPYQSFLYNGKYIEGRVDTVRMYYSLGLSEKMKGARVLDLGCNEGSVCLLAAKDGAAYVVGVETNDRVLEMAQRHAEKAGFTVEYTKEDLIKYIYHAGSYDVITLFAIMRHIHHQLMKKRGYKIEEIGRGYLIYNSFQTLILGENNPVKKEYDEFMSECIRKAKKHFICSLNDYSGLVLRRQEETKRYFKGLSDRVKLIEIFAPLPSTPEYTVIQIKLESS